MAIFAIVLPVYYLLGEQALLIAVPPACLVMTFLFGLWAGRGVGSRFVFHGFLVGAVAALLYIGLTFGQPLPLVYTISHGLKVLGGVTGGFVAERRTKRTIVADVERAV